MTMNNNDLSFPDALAARDPRDPCPTCAAVGGYCGGENHPSCGLFSHGKPISYAEFNAANDKPISRAEVLVTAANVWAQANWR